MSWTPDGAFLIAPTALWYDHSNTSNSPSIGKVGTDEEIKNMISTPSFATYVYARHRYDRPAAVLSGLEKVRELAKAKSSNTSGNLSYA